MLPRNLHLEEINRFHDEMKRLDEMIDKETDESKKGELCFLWFKMSEQWNKIDNFIEMQVKNYLDSNNF